MTPKKKPITKKMPTKTVAKKTTKTIMAKPSKKESMQKKTEIKAEKKEPIIMTKTDKNKPQTEPSPTKKSRPTKEELVLKIRTRKGTPSVFKRFRKATPIVFSLQDVKDLLKAKEVQKITSTKVSSETGKPQPKATERKATIPTADKRQVLGAALLSDVLGFNPKDAKSKPKVQIEESKIPKHFLKYYKELVQLRDKVKQGLDFHAEGTLKRSTKDDTGDLSSYSQHMADAGTDTFDRDFALNLLSNEQDALFEIEEAIQRIVKGTYGICEITNKPINKERLEVVPFTRYSIEGQKQLESTQQRTRERGGLFGESNLEESARYTEDFEE